MPTSFSRLLRISLAHAEQLDEFYSELRDWFQETLGNESLIFYQPEPLEDLPFSKNHGADPYVLRGDDQPPQDMQISALQFRDRGICQDDHFLVHFQTEETWFGALEGSGDVPDVLDEQKELLAELFQLAQTTSKAKLRAAASEHLLRVYEILNGNLETDEKFRALLSVVSDAVDCDEIGFYEKNENHYEHRTSLGFDPGDRANRQFYPRDQLRELGMDESFYVLEPSENADGTDLFLPLTLTRERQGLIVAYETSYDHETLTERDRFTFRIVNILMTLATTAMGSSFDPNREEIWDRITNLRTESFFRTRLKEEVERGDRYGYSFSVLTFEIENLDELGEEFGESSLNEVIRKLSHRIKTTFRLIDTACRFENNQFGVLFPNTEREGAITAGERLIEMVEDPFLSIGDRDVSIRLDGGISKYPEDGGNAEDLLKKARLALYEAKQDETAQLRSSRELE